MLYELIACVRPGNLLEVKEIAKTAGTIVLNSGGVVRGYTNWDRMFLPRRTKKHQASYDRGHYFIMRFDSNIVGMTQMRQTLGLDPRMIRFSIVKMGSKLEEIADAQGKDDTIRLQL